MVADDPREARLPTLRFVIDTNIWVDALTSCGHSEEQQRKTARSCIKKARENGVIMTDERITRDFKNIINIFAKKGELSQREADIVKKIFRNATQTMNMEKDYVRNNKQELDKCKDGDDWPFLIASDTHNAYALVSNDKHLLRIKYKNLKILDAKAFNLEQLPPHKINARKGQRGINERVREEEMPPKGGNDHGGISDADIASAKVVASNLLNNEHVMHGDLRDEGHETTAIEAARQSKMDIDQLGDYRSSLNALKTSLGPSVRVSSPKRGISYGPGRLSVGKKLAVLKLSNSRIIAYRAKDVAARFPEGDHEVESIRRTDKGIQIVSAKERSKNRGNEGRGGISR